ncbi:MAG: urease accessory UreF family protein [Sneathiellaceae bacterium]
MSLQAALLALQHADTAFPSGGFAFSQGLEAWLGLPAGDGGAAPRRMPPERLARFVAQQLRQRWHGADRVAVALAHRCAGAPAALAALDAEVEAVTLNARFRDGSRRNGAALLATHDRLGTDGAAAWRREVMAGRAQGHLAPVQGLVWSGLGLPEEVAVAMSGYVFLTGLTGAAVRLNLVGALGAQAMLRDLLPEVEAAAGEAVAEDAVMTAFTPLTEIAIMQGGQDGARLFSS